jgi:hypothetical protein
VKQPRDIDLTPFDGLRDAWAQAGRKQRIAALESAGRSLHDELVRGPRVLALWAFDLVTLPYPTSYGLSSGTWLPFPFLWIRHRMLVVRFTDRGRVRTLLFNPTDHERARRTPFFWHLAQAYGDFISHRVLSTVHGTFLDHLAAAGVRPEEVDYVAYDHLHTQDIRRAAGTTAPVPDLSPSRLPAALPAAHFLIPRKELAIWQDPHPLEHAWYVPGAIEGLDTERIVLLDGDYRLGDGVMLMSTPGHTMGNQSLVVNTDQGVFVVSENGISPVCFAPADSGIPGLARWARERALEVVPNGNTLESSFDQYDSMLLERAVAGRALADPRFPNVYPSSELTSHLLAPGLFPAFSHGQVRIGRLDASTPGASDASARAPQTAIQCGAEGAAAPSGRARPDGSTSAAP